MFYNVSEITRSSKKKKNHVKNIKYLHKLKISFSEDFLNDIQDILNAFYCFEMKMLCKKLHMKGKFKIPLQTEKHFLYFEQDNNKRRQS